MLSNTAFFGKSTGGLVTANITHGFSDGAKLVVATTNVTERNDTLYKDFVRPHYVIEPKENFNNLGADAAAAAAIEWLKN